jgi:putative hydrolase of the HAD superfamily
MEPLNRFDLIGFDADDTLWDNESLYLNTQAAFKQMLARYRSLEYIDQRLFDTETRNLQYFGYGIKSFALSMIETAIELTDGQVLGKDIQLIIDLCREMLKAEVRLLDGVAETVAALAKDYPLMILTKGELFDQETKVARSGIADYFQSVEVVSDKTEAAYAAVLAKHRVAPARFLMVGNSLRSDILPVTAIGGHAVYIPYELTWAHEAVEALEGEKPYEEIASIRYLPDLIASMSRSG